MPDVMMKCSDCGEEFNECEVVAINGEIVCSECLRDNYTKCSDCGEYIPNDDIFSISSQKLCEDCLNESYTKCYECGEYIENDEVYHEDSYSFCSYCHGEIYTYCCNCDRTLLRDNANWSDEDEEYYCDDCYDGNNENNEHVFNYSYKPSEYNFIRTDKDTNNTLYFGLEIETEYEADESSNIISELYDTFGTEIIYCKPDGSLSDGIEMVTHPHSKRALKEFLPKIEKLLEDYECNCERDTCGLHVHVSKNILSEHQQFKLALLIKEFDTKLYNFAKRTKTNYCLINHISGIKECVRKYQNNERYSALNITPTTLEFRVFAGTNSAKRMILYLTFIEACLDFVKLYSVMSINKSNFVNWIEKEGRYRSLKDEIIKYFK